MDIGSATLNKTDPGVPGVAPHGLLPSKEITPLPPAFTLVTTFAGKVALLSQMRPPPPPPPGPILSAPIAGLYTITSPPLPAFASSTTGEA